MIVRAYTPEDCHAMAQLFYETIHSINAADYTTAQLDAWATGSVDYDRWRREFLEHDTRVAIDNDIIVGFGNMDATGYLDKLFVHRQYQRQGIASAICDVLEHNAAMRKLVLLSTHASITARPFFERRGYYVVKAQQVTRRNQQLCNFVMQKALALPDKR